MKKNVLLTSLVAIGLSCGAHAATDVSFSGNYTQEDGTRANVTDGVKGATYDYTYGDGDNDSVTGVDSETAPDKSKFKYKDKNGEPQSLTDGLPTEDDYTADSAASGSDIVDTTQEVKAGATASRDNYTYTNGAGETTTLGESAQEMRETYTSDYEGYTGGDITVTNGEASGEINGNDYTIELENGTTLRLSEDGSKLVREDGSIYEPSEDSLGQEATEKFQSAQAAFEADKAALEEMKSSTAEKWEKEQQNFNAANDAFTTDSEKIDELTDLFATVGDASDKYDAAVAAQQDAKTKAANQSAAYKEAQDLLDKPIEETIKDGANAAIEESLSNEEGALNKALSEKAGIEDVNNAIDESLESGSLKDALDKKVDMEYAEQVFEEKQKWVDETLGIESAKKDAVKNALTGEIAGEQTTITGAINSLDDAIVENRNNIAAHETRISANETAIADHEDRITKNTKDIADEREARIAGDEATLAAAKAYVEEYNAVALQDAYNYTDNKVNALEKELSAGIAAATAMSSIEVSNVERGEVSVGGGYGYYNSQSAVAFGAAMGLTDNWSVNAAAGLADSNVSFRAGTNYKFKLF